MGEVPHDIKECVPFGNIDGATRISCYIEGGLFNSGGVGSIKGETAHHRVECMNKAEMRFRRLLYEVITLLLPGHNESFDHVRTLGAHICRLCSFMGIASQHSGLGQTRMELQHFPQQSTSTDSFIYCEEEQELRCEESEEHPKHMEEKAPCLGVALGGNVEVQSAPYADDQGAEAKRDDPESAPQLWFFHPQIWGIARSGGIGCRIIHGSVKTVGPAK